MSSATCNAGLTTITVTDGGDAGTGSTCTLRQAIAAANTLSTVGTCVAGGLNQIVFSPALANATITLAQGELSVTVPGALAIVGSGQTIDAAHASRVLYVSGGALVATDLTLTNGEVTPFGLTDRGGGIYVKGATNLQLTNCNITANYAFIGAGIYATSSTVTISNSVISGNFAGYGPGGVSASASSVSFKHSTISGNYAQGASGILGSGSSTLTFVDSTVSGNTTTCAPCTFGALGFRGGVSVFGGSTLTLTNTTVYGNYAVQFAGVYVVDSVATLINATVTGNSVSPVGGGPGLTGFATTTTITLYNSIIAKNTYAGTTNARDCINGSSTPIIAKNTLIGNATDSGIVNGTNGNITGVDPQFGPLANNGGPTRTMALASSSPAIGAGSIALARFNTIPLNYDQRGFSFPRKLGPKIDMGAFQTQGDRLFANGAEPEP
jgi:hypothetical protein